MKRFLYNQVLETSCSKFIIISGDIFMLFFMYEDK